MHLSITTVLSTIGVIVLPALAAKTPSCVAVATHPDMVTFYRCKSGDGVFCNELPLNSCVHPKDGILQIGSPKKDDNAISEICECTYLGYARYLSCLCQVSPGSQISKWSSLNLLASLDNVDGTLKNVNDKNCIAKVVDCRNWEGSAI